MKIVHLHNLAISLNQQIAQVLNYELSCFITRCMQVKKRFQSQTQLGFCGRYIKSLIFENVISTLSQTRNIKLSLTGKPYNHRFLRYYLTVLPTIQPNTPGV